MYYYEYGEDAISGWSRLSREKRVSAKQILKPRLLPSDFFCFADND